MANLTTFIGQNLWLCIAFIAVILIYLIFEIRHMTTQKHTITVQDAISLSNRQRAVFLDIRDDKAYNQKHIVGAIHATIEQLKSSTKILKKHQNVPIIVYCDEGVRAKSACQLLKENGFNAYVLKGGLNQWLKDSMPVDNKSKQPKNNPIEQKG
ncbi:rhodanese-like domain-containing protein [Facilibium subflavum]|uniref:rhodanese-like domain-containing protein n=1 Tax=Facilibium subflavum TaxID=2219058 RepID=UPI000E65A88C|nr:rhodanese-like domain-containing protein [Facilibium subflavum]